MKAAKQLTNGEFQKRYGPWAVIPGAGNRLASFFMRRLLPRQAAIRLMGRVMRGMYGRKT
jgi:hypothetical protein